MTIYPPAPAAHTQLKYLAKAANSMNAELSTNSKPREGVEEEVEIHYHNTCQKCDYRGNRTEDQDWISISTGPLDSERRIIEVGKFPNRCTPCDTKSRRYTRMGATLRKIQQIKNDLVNSSEFDRPKMITIGNKEALDKKEFTRRLKIFHRDCPWLIGGTFVKELGTKPMGDYDGMWHSHGVYIAPWLELEKANEELRTYGLELNKFKQAIIDEKFIDAGLKNYIAKYMCKDGGRKQSVGALYRCVLEEIDVIDSTITIKCWKQPNKKYQLQMKEWIKSQ